MDLYHNIGFIIFAILVIFVIVSLYFKNGKFFMYAFLTLLCIGPASLLWSSIVDRYEEDAVVESMIGNPNAFNLIDDIVKVELKGGGSSRYANSPSVRFENYVMFLYTINNYKVVKREHNSITFQKLQQAKDKE